VLEIAARGERRGFLERVPWVGVFGVQTVSSNDGQYPRLWIMACNARSGLPPPGPWTNVPQVLRACIRVHCGRVEVVRAAGDNGVLATTRNSQTIIADFVPFLVITLK